MQEFDDDLFRTDTAALKAFNGQVIDEFRANSGKVGDVFENFHVLLLTTTGAKSGQPRLTPLTYFKIDGAMMVVGSRGGAPKNPAWVNNLRANPMARVEAGTESFEVIAREVHGERRDAAFNEIVCLVPNYGVYQNRTTRVIPVFELQRRTH
jgi:deazaflavin-dependent oxidoreductase (nitroreductase family)